MKGFGFTRKKFLTLTDKGRHKHLIDWLSGIYQTLAAGRTGTGAFLDFAREYKTICIWMGLAAAEAPVESGVPHRLAYVSDAVHRHRTLLGLAPRDYDLLDRVVTGDREQPLMQRPAMDYQVALDGLRSLFNVGSIYRTCEAAGVDHIILGNCLGKESPQVRKTAMGAQDNITEEHTKDLAGCLETKKARGYHIIAVETISGSSACHDYPWPEKAVIVMGNEEYGISPHVLAAADHAVHIPMFGKKNSLNVANALAAVLYQAVFTRMG
ncbi:MAG: hypothetical protein HUN04_19130 [Desulfobacter sp.]|nr:MAG: hypothetical protein HUN04_19130 [Desulfobacter sp.]